MQPVYPARKKNRVPYKLLLAEAGTVVVILIPIILVLNYFRVITLPFLPQRELVSQKQKDEAIAYMNQPVLYACPLEPDICSTGVQLFDTQKRQMSGVAFSRLASGTEIKAVFDGTYVASEEASVVIVTLSDTKNQDRAVYKFLGSVQSSGGPVKQNDVVGIVNGESAELTEFDPTPYNLYISVEDAVNGKLLPLKPSTDGKALGF